jgi:D-3-phosphoglycerate dehydrogenase
MIVVTDFDYPDDSIERRIVTGANLEFKSLQSKSQAEIVLGAPDAVTLITQYSFIGKECIDGLPKLKHIARYGVGTDIVDVDYATKKGIQVTNVPADYCVAEVADHALAFLLSFARGLNSYDLATRHGEWKWQTAAPLQRLSESTVGIVGMGRIGKAIAERVSAFGCKIVSFDPYVSTELMISGGIQMVTLSQLLELSDYVIIQAPLTAETKNMFDADAISRMKNGSVLINTGRGPIVDTKAVQSALNSGHLRGAGFDDLPEEPSKQKNWEPHDDLFRDERTLITPHAAYYSQQSIAFCREYAATEAVLFAKGLPVRSPVNKVEEK